MFAVTSTAVLFLCLCIICGKANGQTALNAAALKTQLFDGYDTSIRPVNNQQKQITVDIEFFLLAINFLDEVTETMKTTGFLRMYWTDEFLVWDPNLYGNLTLYHYPQSIVWKPDVALKNSYLYYKQLGDVSLNVEVAYNGSVMWSPFQVFESTCAIDITYFPYDEQTCSLIFVAWSYTKTEILMKGGNNGMVMEEFEGNSAWEVTDTSWYDKVIENEASIVFVLNLKRKPLYNMLTLIFPVIMLAILNLFVFALPSEGGEKAGYAVTVFLAFAVFLTIMESTFPQNSDSTAIFAVYVVIETVQSTVITIISLLMIRASAFDVDTSIPSCLICLTRCLKCKRDHKKCNKNRVAALDNLEQSRGELERVKRNKNCVETAEDEAITNPAYTWKTVLDTLDLLFFIFFFLAFIIATVVFLLLAKYQ